MGVSPTRFDGKDLYIPGYYGKRNISGLDVASASGSRLLLIGECKAGIPHNASADYPNVENRINWVSNTNELNEILRDGPAYYGALFALTPSNQPGVNGAPAVGVIRVNPATRSALTLKDVDDNDVLDVKSKDYGLYTTQIRMKITAGTNKGKKISVKFEDQTVEKDDVTYELLTVQYTGTGSAAALTLDPAGNLVVTITTGGAGDDIVDKPLIDFDNVSQLVDWLNAYQNTAGTNVYSAILIGDEKFTCQKLDKIIAGDSIDIKTEKTISAILEACFDWINDSSDYLVNTLTTGGERRPPKVMTGHVYLSGGIEGETLTTHWTDSLDQIAALTDASFIGVLSGEAAVHAALSAHCTLLSSSSGRNERQGCVGADDGDIKSVKITKAKAINSSLMGFVADEIKRYDKNGVEQIWDSFYGACEILGMSAGNAITFAPTNKMINAIAVKEKHTKTEIEDYIKAGIMTFQPSELGGIRTKRSVTTYQGSNIIANEWSAMRTALYITKDHRTYVEALIGEAGDATVFESIDNRARLRLDDYVDNGWLVVDPQYGNAWRSYQFSVVGDVVKITYEGTIVIPVNFMLVTHSFVVVGFKK